MKLNFKSLHKEKEVSTKEKIYQNALELFSHSGFDGVSMRDIADKIGLRVSSLYNHFDNKESILGFIFDKLEDYYNKITPPPEEILKMFENPSIDMLRDLTSQAIHFYLGKPWILKTWRIIFIERFKNSRAKSIFLNNLLEGAIEFQIPIFKKLLKDDLRNIVDLRTLAREFHGHNVFLVFRYMDKLIEEESYEEALKEIEGIGHLHVKNFSFFFKDTP